MICETCNKEHNGEYNKRFCSLKCARAYSTKFDNKNELKQVYCTKCNKIEYIKKRRSAINFVCDNCKYTKCKICGKRLLIKKNINSICLDCLRHSDQCKNLRSEQGKYVSSFVHTYRNKTNKFYESYDRPFDDSNYKHKLHNDEEIQKWINYINTLNINIPKYEKRQSQDYYVLTNNSNIHIKGTHFIFEHRYLMNIIFNGQLTNINIVHHIDNNGLNNNLSNLLVFESDKDHKRFHNSKNAYLIYNENTHLFNCLCKK